MINKNEPCCENKNPGLSCCCSANDDSGKPIERKTLKFAIFVAVILAVAGILTYKFLPKNNTNRNISIGGNSLFLYNRFSSNIAVNFAFGQPALETTSNIGISILAEQNIGNYVTSLDELNLVAVDNETIIVFIPGADNILIDDMTKNSILSFQKSLTNEKKRLVHILCGVKHQTTQKLQRVLLSLQLLLPEMAREQ
jgi:hypothetical protein